jgi:hypothetical protein
LRVSCAFDSYLTRAEQRALDLAAKAHQEDPNFQGRVMILRMVSGRFEALDTMIPAYEYLVSRLEAHSTLTTVK